MVEAGVVIVDVRRPYEYEGGRIAGSRNIEMNELAGMRRSCRATSR